MVYANLWWKIECFKYLLKLRVFSKNIAIVSKFASGVLNWIHCKKNGYHDFLWYLGGIQLMCND